MGCEKSVLSVNPGVQTQFTYFSQNQGLISRLLGIFSEGDDPSGIQGGIDVIVAAVNIQSMFGQSSRCYGNHHGTQFSGGMVILLNPIDNSLAGSEIHHPFAGNRHGDCSPLSGVLPFGLDCHQGIPKGVQVSLGVQVLKHFALFGGRGDRVKNSCVGNQRFSIQYQLIPVACDLFPRLFGGGYFLFISDRSASWILGSCQNVPVMNELPGYKAFSVRLQINNSLLDPLFH